MNRRQIVRGWLVGLSLVATGCGRLREQIRQAGSETDVKKDKLADESETSKILDVQADPKKPTPFFKQSRLSGAWSSEGREIEHSLGVH